LLSISRNSTSEQSWHGDESDGPGFSSLKKRKKYRREKTEEKTTTVALKSYRERAFGGAGAAGSKPIT